MSQNIAGSFPTNDVKVSDFTDDWFAGPMFYLDPVTNSFDQSGVYLHFAEKQIVVSDEIFWNNASPQGEKLANIVEGVQKTGWEAGIVVTPAMFMDVDSSWNFTLKSDAEIAALSDKLCAEIKNSGVDFVGVDPYKGLMSGISDEFLLQFTHIADDLIHSLGKKAMLVVQGFAKVGEEQATLDFITKQLIGQNYDDVVVFGYEDAHDLQQAIGFIGIDPTKAIDIGLGG